MRIDVNGVELFTITPEQKKVIEYEVSSDVFEADIKRRLFWVINECYKVAIQQMKNEWIPVLKAEETPSIPLDDQAFADLIMARPDYKDAKARQASAQE